MISKELLSEVLCIVIDGNPSLNKNEINYTESFGCRYYINIYELAHKCKEWLIKECHQCVWSGKSFSKLDGYECSICSFYGGKEKIFEADTEPEAILSVQSIYRQRIERERAERILRDKMAFRMYNGSIR